LSAPTDDKGGGVPPPSTSNLYPTGGLETSPRSCRIIARRKPKPAGMGGAKGV
jgi:hypothetical protein